MSGYRLIRANTRRFSWCDPKGNTGSFEPKGTLWISGDGENAEALAPNPRGWRSSKPLWSARILVGFNVGGKPKWKMDDVVKIVRSVRVEQVGNPGASFLYQKGLYSSEARIADPSDPRIVSEDGAQIVILNLESFGTSAKAFEQQMVELAETLAEKLRQDEVILEMQRSGISKSTSGITPRAQARRRR